MIRQLRRTAVVIRNPQFLEKRGEGSRAWSWTDGESATPVNSESWNIHRQYRATAAARLSDTSQQPSMEPFNQRFNANYCSRKYC